jgi:hypothetical protein
MKRDLMSMALDLGQELIIDNFAGDGGTSTGLEWAFGRPLDIAINHDPEALAMHAANHPYTKSRARNCEGGMSLVSHVVALKDPPGLVEDAVHAIKSRFGLEMPIIAVGIERLTTNEMRHTYAAILATPDSKINESLNLDDWPKAPPHGIHGRVDMLLEICDCRRFVRERHSRIFNSLARALAGYESAPIPTAGLQFLDFSSHKNSFLESSNPTMMYNLARPERQHRAIHADTRPLMHFAMRTCTDACRRQRSVGQFGAGSSVCLRCARRAP